MLYGDMSSSIASRSVIKLELEIIVRTKAVYN